MITLPDKVTIKRDFLHVAHKNGALEKTGELTTWIESPLLFKNGKPDWKRTAAAIGEQLIINQEQTRQIVNSAAIMKRTVHGQENEIATLSQDLGDVLASNRRHATTLRVIRTHWSAFLLPRELR